MSSLTNVDLTIRSTIKKIDEINFQCPLSWTIFQLKTFVAMSHKQGQDYFKPSKTQLYFGGGILNDNDTLATVLANKNLRNRYTFIAKFMASMEPEANEQNLEEELQKLKIIDDHSKLFMNPLADFRRQTNIEEIECFSKLPIMVDSVAKQWIKSQYDESENNDQTEGVVNENEEQEERNLEQQYIIKLAIRILIVFFLFRAHFQGVLFYIFLAVLAVYCLIKLSQRRVKQRRQVGPQNPARPGAPNVEAQGQNAEQQAPAAPPGNQTQPNFLNKIKEFVVCFISSFYPSWDMNLYIENNPVAQPENALANPENAEANNGGNAIQNATENADQNNNNNKPNEEPGKEVLNTKEAINENQEVPQVAQAETRDNEEALENPL